MQLDRTKNAGRNIIWGMLNKLIKTGFPFIIRTVIIYELGINYVGLNSLFTSILSTLSLAELGFDTAIVTIMYKSVANNNKENLNALLYFIKKAYLLVGCIILISGICCIPFLKYLIKDASTIPTDINIKVLFVMFLINTVTTYFFGGYKTCILEAYQRQDIISNINTISTVVFSFFEILILFLTHNYYLYILVMILSNFFINGLTYLISKKKYPDIMPKGTLDKQELAGLKKILAGTFLGKVGGVLSLSFDSIVISTFLGITVLAYYTNYTYIINAITGFLAIVYTSMQAGIGNSIQLDNIEKNFNDMLKFTFLYDWIVGWCSICLLYLLKPFITLWIGNNGVLPDFVLCFIVLDFYIVLCGGIQGTYKNAAGIWWEDRYRCLIGGIFNLGLNIVLVLALKKIGDYYALAGVLLSTILSDILILTPWSLYVTFKYYFKNGAKEYVFSILKYFFITITNIIICYIPILIIDKLIGNHTIVILIVRFAFLLIVPNLIYYVIYRKSNQFHEAYNFVQSKIKFYNKLLK